MEYGKGPNLFFCMWKYICFSKHHMLKRLSFSHCVVLAPLSKIIWPYFSRMYFLTIYCVPLVNISIFMPVSYCINYRSFVVCFEIKKYEASSFVLLFQECFGQSGPTWILGFFSISAKIAIGILIGIALNL